jgi:hypothetical protein
MPRGLIFIASLWLIASWLLAIGVRTPVQPSSASYTPGIQLMLQCIAIGLFVGWPLLRLSQRATALPIRQTLLDLVVLLTLCQVVLWPLRLVTPWTVGRTAAIDAALSGWLLLAGAVVAAAVGAERNGPRSLAMLACIAMLLLGPALAWLGVATGFTAVIGVDAMELINLSPLMAIRWLGEGGGAQPTLMQWRWLGLLGVAAVAVWVALGLSLGFLQRRQTIATGRPTP